MSLDFSPVKKSSSSRTTSSVFHTMTRNSYLGRGRGRLVVGVGDVGDAGPWGQDGQGAGGEMAEGSPGDLG